MWNSILENGLYKLNAYPESPSAHFKVLIM